MVHKESFYNIGLLPCIDFFYKGSVYDIGILPCMRFHTPTVASQCECSHNPLELLS